MNSDHDQVIPLWLERLHEESPHAERPPESAVRPGDIRTLFGQHPMPINQLVYVVDTEQVGTSDSGSVESERVIADVIAIHDDPLYATHNDLIIPRDHSQRNLNTVLRVPLLAKVPVTQLSAAPVDQISDIARSAIERYEYGTVPDSPLAIGTSTNGPRDPRWQFCDETHEDFYLAVDTSWRTYLMQLDVDESWYLLRKFSEDATRSFTAAEFNSFVSWVENPSSSRSDRAAVAASPPTWRGESDWLDGESEHGMAAAAVIDSSEESALELALSALNEYAEIVVSTNLLVSAIDSFLLQTERSMKAMLTHDSKCAVAARFIEIADDTGLFDGEVWANVIVPQHKNVALDVQIRWFRLMDFCRSFQITATLEIARTS